jgi:predicted phage terminase large subunit-like protein
LWKRAWIDQSRLATRPELVRIVVAVDPPVTSNANSDACGIVVAGLGADGRGYVLADRTIRGREPIVWARAAVAAYRDYSADRIVAETNQGGDLVAGVIRQVDENVPIRGVKATRGKWIRAEPVSTLYAEGRVLHVGEFVELEAEMCSFAADGLAQGKSPDRLDALVWAITDLMLTRHTAPGLRQL